MTNCIGVWRTVADAVRTLAPRIDEGTEAQARGARVRCVTPRLTEILICFDILATVLLFAAPCFFY